MPFMKMAMAFVYMDRRHKPRGPRPQLSMLVLFQDGDGSHWVCFANERGYVHGSHGTWYVQDGFLHVHFCCLGGIMRHLRFQSAEEPFLFRTPDRQGVSMRFAWAQAWMVAHQALGLDGNDVVPDDWLMVEITWGHF